MYAVLTNGAAWLVVIGLVIVAFMLASAGLGALIGNALALFKRKGRT
jgi:hypothetical protein